MPDSCQTDRSERSSGGRFLATPGAEDDTAFSGGRSPRYGGFLIACGPTPALLVADRAWVRSLWDALRPHMISSGSYINTVIEEEDRIRASYGQDERLARIKGRYDPGNLFHRTANIKPI